MGPESVKLSSLEGILARELVPITRKTWLEVPEDVKDKLWACVKVTFTLYLFIILADQWVFFPLNNH